MLYTLLITLAVVGVCVLLLGIKIFFTKAGKFPHFHISGNKEMMKRGIDCVESQDRNARKPSRLGVIE
ncbi:MAG: hypothetical protein E7100_00120 [Bacteroidaceae bacterium]|jgi:hypothetical protein|nr:hypothetical protein [Bacteroidaceae bacterium]MBP3833041.1 hypothetical protein [Bacteroidaceae bacterium]MBQ8485877.1 hypothetical protein [Bacteroidaceae bacterium]MBQ9675535.1 hypothetical protein [Bacteroidaceae bacterium]